MSRAVVNALIVLAVVLLVALPLALVGGGFDGTDGLAVERIDATGYVPWAAPPFEPAPETASGLFALQAALGAGVLGYVLGTYRARRARPRA